MHDKISAGLLAENTSIYPLQRKKLKLNWSSGKSRKQTKQNGEQLGENNAILIWRLSRNATNKNTLQSTNNWLKVRKSWATKNSYDKSTIDIRQNSRVVYAWWRIAV